MRALLLAASIGALLLLGVGAPEATSATASFDCKKAGSAVEHMICTDPYLSDADQWLAGLYRDGLATDSDPQRTDLMRQQRLWLASRDRCVTDGAQMDIVIDCLRSSYDRRIEELETPLRRFVDLSDEAPGSTDACSAVAALRRAGRDRLIARHALVLDKVDRGDLQKVRKYLSGAGWDAAKGAQMTYLGEGRSFDIGRVQLYGNRPEAWIFSTSVGSLDNPNLWLFESTSDGTMAEHMLGHLGEEGSGPFEIFFVRFQGQPYAVERSIGQKGAYLVILGLDASKPVCKFTPTS